MPNLRALILLSADFWSRQFSFRVVSHIDTEKHTWQILITKVAFPWTDTLGTLRRMQNSTQKALPEFAINRHKDLRKAEPSHAETVTQK